MRLTRQILSLAAAVFALACGGGGGGSTGPYNNGGNPPPGGGNQTLGSISVSGQMSLAAGDSHAIAVTALDTQGAAINSFSPNFSSADVTVAEVSGSGAVLGLRAGSTTVTVSVTVGGVTKTANVAVTVTGTLPNSATISAGPDATFQPGTIVVAAGATVTWAFGSVTHTVSFVSSGSGTPQSISDSYNTQVARTFNTKGDYQYQCTIHYGMSGLIVVR